MSTINEINFSDIYITPDKVAYIPDGKTANGLMKIKTDDFNYFYDKVESCYDGSNPSYSVLYNKILYRVERSVSIYGIQYCARKMPPEVPAFNSLGFAPQISVESERRRRADPVVRADRRRQDHRRFLADEGISDHRRRLCLYH